MGVLVGAVVAVGEGSTGGSFEGSLVSAAVAVGVGGGWVAGARVFVLLGIGLAAFVLVGAVVQVGQTVIGVEEVVGLAEGVAVNVGVSVSVRVTVTVISGVRPGGVPSSLSSPACS